MATSYRLKVARGTDVFEAEGDKRFVEDMLKKFGETEKLPGETREPRRNGSSKPLSVGEFVRQVGVKKHVDLVLAFGYYLEKYDDRQQFSVADINKCYYEAKLENSNSSMMIQLNIKHTRMMLAKGEKGKKPGYTLTHSGLAFIESKLNNKSEQE